MMQLTITRDTFLKIKPQDSRTLTDDQKMFVKAGTVYPIAAISQITERGHLKVTLGEDEKGNQLYVNGYNTVYIFEDHTNYSRLYEISDDGLALLKSFEGCELEAYDDGVGVCTIGYGHTKNTYWGMKIDQETAEYLLRQDLAVYETAVNKLVSVSMSQNQFDSLVCFSFNVGTGSFEKSTLLRLLNGKDYTKVASEFIHWDKAGGSRLPGLTRRRKAERALFLGQDWKVF